MKVNDKDLVHLARLAIEGKTLDVVALIRRIIRKLGNENAETAEQLQNVLKRHSSMTRRNNPLPTMPVDLESRLELAKYEPTLTAIRQPIWNPNVAAKLSQVVDERRHQDLLAQADLQPTRTILFIGPPGVGKTLTARWLAQELSLPIVTLDLAAVMSSYLGRTGNNLRNVLDYSKSSSCVLLLDEFDAIAKRRADAVEVGELKRLVTVLLQEIDNWPPTGILIAATNHPELLDPAIWRRFDVVVDFGLPTDKQIKELLGQMLSSQKPEVLGALATVLRGMSFSDIQREILTAKRKTLLEKSDLGEAIIKLVSEKIAGLSKKEKQKVSVNLAKATTQRMASEITGISRDTIRKHTNDNSVEDDNE